MNVWELETDRHTCLIISAGTAVHIIDYDRTAELDPAALRTATYNTEHDAQQAGERCARTRETVGFVTKNRANTELAAAAV